MIKDQGIFSLLIILLILIFNLISWQIMDIVGRKLMLVTTGT